MSRGKGGKRFEFDEIMYAETRDSLLAVTGDSDELAELVEEQLADMKDSGFFDIEI